MDLLDIYFSSCDICRLNFRWYTVPQRELDRRQGDRTIPVRTPTMAGGLFSIDREYFYHIGGQWSDL